MAKRKRRRKSTKKPTTISLSQPAKAGKCVCPSCCGSRSIAWLLTIIGLLFLVHDYGGFKWWKISWFTIIFLLIGITMLKK